MLYYKNKPFYLFEKNLILADIKSLAMAIPGIGNHIYDSADPNAQFDVKDFAFFKNTNNDSNNKFLQFISKRITQDELNSIAKEYGFEINDGSKSGYFTIKYNNIEVPCRWSGGPGGAANTNIQTELKEYATQVAIELGPRNVDDPDAIKRITEAVNFILSKSKYKAINQTPSL